MLRSRLWRAFEGAAWTVAAVAISACSSSDANPSASGGSGGGGTGGAAGAGVAGSGGVATGGTAGSEPIFPSTPVLDPFDTDGQPDATWTPLGSGSPWVVQQGTLHSQGEQPETIVKQPLLGPKQEAFVTVAQVPSNGAFYLMFECSGVCDCAYAAIRGSSLHFGYKGGSPCIDNDTDVTPLSIKAGDQLGIRTHGDANVSVFVNGTFTGSHSLSGWSGVGQSGNIGLGADFTGYSTESVAFDLFGGGQLL